MTPEAYKQAVQAFLNSDPDVEEGLGAEYPHRMATVCGYLGIRAEVEGHEVSFFCQFEDPRKAMEFFYEGKYHLFFSIPDGPDPYKGYWNLLATGTPAEVVARFKSRLDKVRT